jgi:PKD repeat protein
MNKLLLIFVLILFFTLPVFAQVDTAWVRTYDGPINGHDLACAVEVDNIGNVYVAGRSDGDGTGVDYATIKYYPNGDTAWVRRYNGPGNGDDIIRTLGTIAVDASGNVYVTGRSVGDGTSYDYATIKYYSNGDTAWIRRYNGPGNSDDWSYALALDNSGNIYVTGYSGGSGTYYDYATIKYYPNGDTAWVRRYSGLINSSIDQASSIAVDGSANVYVTGWSSDSTRTSYDYATIKYYPNGDTAWVRRYNGPGNDWDWAYDIALDSSGNIYVTGYSFGAGTGDDYATIKYYPDGDTAWVRRYNGLENSDDRAYKIAIDKFGFIFVTGMSDLKNYGSAIIKYDRDGNQLWARPFLGGSSSLTTDRFGSVYVAGNGIRKYDSEGNEVWHSPDSINYYYGITLDSAGNVYATGQELVYSDDNPDLITIKLTQLLDPSFTGSPKAGYKPLSVSFKDISEGNPTGWQWDFGDGNTDTVQHPIHIYSDTGHFDVKLIVSDGVSTDTIIKPNYISVFDTLSVDFTAEPTHGRKPLTVSFQSIYNVMPESVTWYFGDGQTSIQLNPVHKYTEFGNYDVKLVAELFGYKDSVIKEEYIKVSDIKAEFSADKRCGSVPLEVTFSDSSTGTYPKIYWHWDFGDGDTSNLQNPTHQFTNTDVFDITLIVFDSIGADTLTKKGYITTQDSVSADLVGLPNSGRSSLIVMFEPFLNGIANQYFWDFGDGDTSSLRNPIHTYTTQGKCDVKLKVRLELDDCSQEDSIIKEDYIIVNDLQAKFSANPASGVEPLIVQFTDSSTGNPDTWFWDFGDGNTSTQQNPQHQYDTSGVYDVFLRINNSLFADSLLKLDYIHVDSQYIDLFAEISSSMARPGFDLWFYCFWTNIGTSPSENCTLKVLPPTEITSYNILPGHINSGTYSGYTFSGDTIIIPLQTIAPSNYYGGYVAIYGNLPSTVQIGDTLVCKSWLTSSTPEHNLDNNYALYSIIVIGSWDPNDKLASPEGEGSSKTIGPNQRLAYTIQFENKAEATAEAIYIRIVDTLSKNLDWGTLALGASSHPDKCDYEFNPYTGEIIWFCDSIMLPPNVNPPEGEGYFTYSISPKKGLPDETEIANTAWIRFDYNEWLQAPMDGPILKTIKYPFIRGDANGDKKLSVSDVIYIINYLFKGGPVPVPIQSADCNCDTKVTVSDVVYLINYLFKGGPAPVC